MNSVSFKGRLAVCGQKTKESRALRLCIPTRLAAQMMGEGLVLPGWVRVTVTGAEPLFLYTNRPPSRPSADFTLPRWRFPDFKCGDEIEVTVENPEPWRAKSETGKSFDWLPFVDTDEYFPTEEGENLLLWNRYSPPFAIRRYPTENLHWWLLGFYQAEGSKTSGQDFSAASKLPLPLKEMISALTDSWGISKDRLSIEVLHKSGEPPEPAVALYSPLDVRITAIRPRVDKRDNKIGEHAGVLHVTNSKPLKRLVNAALKHVFAADWKWPSEKAAKQYALGWLDGDGSITITTSNPELRLAGLEDEHLVMASALQKAFGWNLKGSGWISLKNGTHITLRLVEILQLLDAGAFQFSMSHVRLLLGFGDLVAGLVAGNRWGAYVRWGLVDTDSMLTEVGETVCRGFGRWAQEIEKARQLKATAPHLFGQKCVANPLRKIS